MSKTRLTVGAHDAGFVFRADGSVEILMPFTGAHDTPAHLLTASALLWACQHPEMMDHIVDAMDAEHEHRSPRGPPN